MASRSLASMAPFQAVLADPAAVAKAFKAGGGKVVGVRCLFVPEEVIWAAGMLPYPVFGTPEPVRQADAYFQSCTCEFVRNVFDHAMDGRLAFLDGLALSNTCDALRKMLDMWEEYVPGVPAYLINHPQKLREASNRDYYMEELRRFRTWVEGIAGRRVGDDDISRAILLYNETRRLLREVYSLRRAAPPALSGEEAFTVAMACSILPRDQANPLLRALLAELRATPAEPRDGPRIMVTGSVLDTPVLIRMIEEEGGVVVADDLCPTSRAFWHLVDETGDPMEAIWRFDNDRVLCACMHPIEARIEHLAAMAQEFDAVAVVEFNLKYCHPFLFDAPLVKRSLEERGLTVNVLEVGHDNSGHGQLRTRLQAFVEMLSF